MTLQLHVLIVGAGIGGLMLAVLLERANISYEIFEKTQELRPLGSAFSLHSSLMVLFEQLGMYDELLSISKPFGALHLRKEDLSLIGSLLARAPGIDCAEHYGDYNRVVGRPELVNMLLKCIPSHKIHYQKRGLSVTQDEGSVTLYCSDNTIYSGSILVGADGAYSNIRQSLYKEFINYGLHLPKADLMPMSYGYDCLVGITHPLDPGVYSILKEKYCEFEILLSNSTPYTWWFIPLVEDRFAWMVTQDIQMESVKESRTPDWTADTAAEMCDRVRHFPCPYGGTLGDIIDKTPNISKVILEDKYFSTWYNGRTVLIGDACHKMVPFGGQGANMAILGALHLANLLYDIHSDSQEEITRIFKEYCDLRRESAKNAVDGSSKTGLFLHGKVWKTCLK
ncbi:hypothetical protein BCR41DRAFT_171909 [Lobosporangium transversale]|uniref:FAD-binding domain-containing protein n=1 Tax=Lobosporangium transversale TaxID=64571 RepID=A0A1Y2GFF5_9FUNG|nr:hypothetical protein BCR41DRAFT_171909 [Lobosporangium transversale]ORZ06152.1 hypothetical protein BCR41DRAFT_171909 [Lobosporangium transversale]|eukprot:XP_021877421.1 hypothetical protein BCR41DRAFT_171909 [Lobosporangium transversale]